MSSRHQFGIGDRHISQSAADAPGYHSISRDAIKVEVLLSPETAMPSTSSAPSEILLICSTAEAGGRIVQLDWMDGRTQVTSSASNKLRKLEETSTGQSPARTSNAEAEEAQTPRSQNGVDIISASSAPRRLPRTPHGRRCERLANAVGSALPPQRRCMHPYLFRSASKRPLFPRPPIILIICDVAHCQ